MHNRLQNGGNAVTLSWMTLRWFALVGLALLSAGVFAGFGATHPAAAGSVHTLAFTARTATGLDVELHFLVRAEDDEAAYAAAIAAARTLVPGGDLPGAGGDTVRAAFAFWPWQWPQEQLPVPVGYNPAGAPVGTADDAIVNGLLPWNSVASSAFRVRYTGHTSATPDLQASILDGQNTVGWMDLGCGSGCVLGVTTKLQSAYEVDLVLNSSAAARLGDGTGGTADVQSIVLHEVGHLAGLEHSCQPYTGSCTEAESASVMFPRYQGIRRELGADDIAGISALYPASLAMDMPAAQQTTVDYPVNLAAGWNLATLPPGPLQYTVGQLDCVAAVYARSGGEWLVWVRDGSPALNSLSLAQGDAAYWVYATASCSETFTLTRSS